MASGKSSYLENKDLDHNNGKTAFTMPSVWLALCTVTPTAASTGATITEPTYTGYARLAIPAASLNAASGGSTASNADLVFAACTGGSSAIVGFITVDSGTTGAGNALYWGSMTSKTIDVNNTPPTVKSGSFTVTES